MIPRSLVAAMALLFPAITGAQTVRGTVVDQGDQPVAGVVVQLLDSASEIAARALTNERGEFRLTAQPGTYRLRTLRIGFRPVVSPFLVLRAGDDLAQRVALAGLPVSLGTVHVVGRNPCSAMTDSTASIYLVWEQVRTALTAAQLSAGTRTIIATTIGFDRTLDASARRIRDHRATIRQEYVRQPWGSLSPDSLRRAGYVVAGSDGYTSYHAPGLDVLLSNGFVEDHCFRLAPASDSSRLGIIFEPIPERRRIAEIQGTLWLDRASSELRSLEFGYANIARDQSEHAGGEMEFARMANGGWVIWRWSISMPVLELRPVAFRPRAMEPQVAEIKVTGGELSVVRRGRDTLWSRPPLVLAGVVIDSATSAAVPGARVALAGTDSEKTTGNDGRFSIPGVLPGSYTVEVRTASLDSVGAVYQSPLAFSDSASTLQLRVPTARQIASALCGASRGAAMAPNGIVVGSVSTRGDAIPPANVKVMVEWDELSVRGEGAFIVTDRRPRRIETRTTNSGSFRVCGVPTGTALVVRAESDRATAVPVEVRIPSARRFARAALVLDRNAADRGAVFTGVVLTDSTRVPIANAEVALPALSRITATNSLGEFRLADIPAGTYQVIVRRIGYGLFEGSIPFAANQLVERQVLLTRIAVLDKVVVTAERTAIPSFEEHRSRGLGRFLTRADLAPQEGRRLAAILEQVSGVDILSGTNRSWIATNRGPRSLSADCPLDRADLLAGAKCGPCYAHVFLDNALIFRGAAGEGLFDLNTVPPAQIEAIEFYAGPAQTPLRYSGLNSACGVLVIHTRRSP